MGCEPLNVPVFAKAQWSRDGYWPIDTVSRDLAPKIMNGATVS